MPVRTLGRLERGGAKLEPTAPPASFTSRCRNATWRDAWPRYSRLAAACSIFAISGCSGRQSVLAPAGEDAAHLFQLFLVMLVGAVLLWFLVNGAFYIVTHISPRRMSRQVAEGIIIVGGILVPSAVLAALLTYGLSMMPDQRAPGDGLVVRIVGEQWWWRVEYWPEGATEPIVSANELRLPADLRSEIVLTSDTVIHSFWVPALGGKLDMFPGRETRFSLRPTEPGLYRGQCAEFCGASHALMAFETVVLPEAEFLAWLEDEAGPAEVQAGEGARIFAREGCGACHTVRGTEARGNVGPDLTHVGSRHSIGAGILGTEPEDFARWVAYTQLLKPEVEMPSYSHLSEDELMALASYLVALK